MKKQGNAQIKSRCLISALCVCTGIGVFIGYNAPSAKGTMLLGDMSWLTALFGGFVGFGVGLIFGLVLPDLLFSATRK